MSRAREAARQQALVQALLQARVRPPAQGGQDLPPGLRAPAGIGGGTARGLQAYRGNARALAGKALGAVFPQLQATLGEAEFAALAWAFWRQDPPACGELGCWGQVLPEFLAAQPGMEDRLPDMARIEWALHAAERAPDAALDADSLQALAREDAGRLRLLLRPGLSLLHAGRAATAPWLPDPSDPSDPSDAGADSVGLLVWRQVWKGRLCTLAPDWHCFMGELLAGRRLQQALDRVLAAHPRFDLAAWLTAALSRAWLQAVLVLPEETS